VLGLVLGYLVESNYRRSLLISNGELSIFLTDKVSLALLVLAALLTAYTLFKELATARAVKKEKTLVG
jgi:putative tricarboxylic transport membrane protein